MIPAASVRVKNIAYVAYGLGEPPPLSDDGVPIIRATNIFRGRIQPDGLIFAALDDLPLDRAPLLRQGEILVVRSGAYTGDSALVTSLWAGSAPGYDLRVTPFGVEPRFLAYVLLSTYGMDQIDLARSRAAQPHLNADDLGNLRLRLPDPGGQRAIADYLDAETTRIDALIEKKRRLVALMRERFSAFVSVETRASAVTNKSDAPHDWQLVQIRRCLRSSDYGIGVSSQPTGPIAVLGMGNVENGRVVGEAGGYVEEVDSSLLLRPGDLLYNRTNSLALVGKVARWNGSDAPTTFASYLVRLRTSPIADSEYLNYLLNTREMLGLARAIALPSIGQANLNPTRYSAIVVPVPPRTTQTRIVRLLNREQSILDRTTEALNRQVRLLGEHRQAIITAAVTGDLPIQGIAAA